MAAHARVAGARIIPLLLAVRDELAGEDPPPRGLAGRADALLLAVAEASGSKRPDKPPQDGGERAGQLLHHLLDLAPDAVLTIRDKGGVGVWNRAGREMTGRRRRDVQRRGPRSLFKEPEAFDALLAEVAAGGGTKVCEAVLLHAKGEEVPIRLFAAHLERPPPGRADGDRTLLIFHDLSEVHGIRRRLTETEKLSAMVKIVGSVAHEFRNPLNSLFLSADLLEDELAGHGAAEEAIAPTLAAIREEVERLNQIINHYLALSKVESTAPEIVDLGETVRAFSEEWQERAAERDLDLKLRVHEGDLSVSVDPNQVRRILVNLVENACDALAESEGDAERPRPTLTLAVRPMRRTVKLTVRDNGPGIEQDLRDRVFEPFYTSKARGSGLGLYLVREIVLAHGGTIALAGNGGRGTSVVIHWPRPEGARRMTASTDAALRILIVDDDRNSRESLSRALRRDGYEILVGREREGGPRDGAGARARSRADRPEDAGVGRPRLPRGLAGHAAGRARDPDLGLRERGHGRQGGSPGRERRPREAHPAARRPPRDQARARDAPHRGA